MYKRLNEEEAIILSRRIEDEYGGRRYGEAWKVINGITRRKNPKMGLLKEIYLKKELIRGPTTIVPFLEPNLP